MAVTAKHIVTDATLDVPDAESKHRLLLNAVDDVKVVKVISSLL